MYRQVETRSRWRVAYERAAISNGGRRRLWALAAIVVVGTGLRVGFAVAGYEPEAPDARGYARIAETLHEDHRFDQRGAFVARDIQDPSNYSPGLPLLVAAIYELRGGADLQLARLVLALIGGLAIPLAFLVGRRLGGADAGLFGAGVVAVYPPFLEQHGMLMTEPLAATLLTAAVLATLRAGELRSTRHWLVPGALIAALAMVRPEYLLFAGLLPPLAYRWTAGSPRRRLLGAGLAALAVCLVIGPWTVRNLIVLDRVVPISTGGGKVLFIGSDIAADANQNRVRQRLLEASPRLRREVTEAYLHSFPASPEPWLLLSQRRPPRTGFQPQILLSQRIKDSGYPYLDNVLDTVAARRAPGVPSHIALGSIGRERMIENASERPIEFGALMLRKAGQVWEYGPRRLLTGQPFAFLHAILVALAALGFALTARRQPRAALLIAVLAIGATAFGAILIASPRRAMVLMPLIGALAGVGLARLLSFREWRRGWARRSQPA